MSGSLQDKRHINEKYIVDILFSPFHALKPGGVSSTVLLDGAGDNNHRWWIWSQQIMMGPAGDENRNGSRNKYDDGRTDDDERNIGTKIYL